MTLAIVFGLYLMTANLVFVTIAVYPRWKRPFSVRHSLVLGLLWPLWVMCYVFGYVSAFIQSFFRREA